MDNPFKSAVEGIRSGMMMEPGVVDKIFDKPIELVHEDPTNPRSVDNKGYSEDSLKDLSDDIRVNGIINAIVVREHPTIKGEWQIVSGHRRFRAAKMAGLKSVPVRIARNVDYKLQQISENIHREDLSLMEMQTIIRDFVKAGMTSYEISQALHKSQSFVAQHFNLMKAPQCILELIDKGIVKNANAGSELCRAYRDDKERTESQCNLWLMQSQKDKEIKEVGIGDARELRRSIKDNQKSAERKVSSQSGASLEKKETQSNPEKWTKKNDGEKFLRRYVKINVKYKGMPGTISLDKAPSEAGKVWFIPEGVPLWEAYEVLCTDIQMLSIEESR